MKSNKHFSRLLMLFALAFYAKIGFGQNLVPNPGFENITECDYNGGGFDLGSIENWFRPSNGTSDWFNACDSSYCAWGVPDNKFGFNVPAVSGGGYVGLYSTVIEDGANIDQREYVAIELADTLETGQYYSIGFSVRLANFSNISANIGLHFTDTVPYLEDTGPFNLIPNALELVSVNDQDNWEEFETIYQGEGGERFLTIGNLRDNSNSTIDTLPTQNLDHCLPGFELQYAYYYIDDVWVEEVTVGVPSLDGSELSPISIYPNPAHTQFSFSSPFLSEYDAVQVRGMDGRLHIEHPTDGVNQTIDVSRLARGSYFVHFVGKGRRPQAMPLILVEGY